MPTLWVRVVQYPETAASVLIGSYGPDVPLNAKGEPEVGFAADIPVEIQRAHPNRGKPLVAACRIRVSEEDAERIRAAGKVVKPSAQDEAITEACSLPDDSADKRFRDGTKARERFRVLARRGIPKTVLRRALLEAARRGVRLREAEVISDELGLETEPARRGV